MDDGAESMAEMRRFLLHQDEVDYLECVTLPNVPPALA